MKAEQIATNYDAITAMAVFANGGEASNDDVLDVIQNWDTGVTCIVFNDNSSLYIEGDEIVATES